MRSRGGLVNYTHVAFDPADPYQGAYTGKALPVDAALGKIDTMDLNNSYNAAVLEREEEEFALADRLLCPPAFVAQTFLDEGFPNEKLARHVYGYDERTGLDLPGLGWF